MTGAAFTAAEVMELRARSGAPMMHCKRALTDADGRVPALLPKDTSLATGKYRITFDVGACWSESFYPEVSVTFWVKDVESHYHIPLLMSPFGFTTYRGS